jgi:hypothetical protein
MYTNPWFVCANHVHIMHFPMCSMPVSIHFVDVLIFIIIGRTIKGRDD